MADDAAPRGLRVTPRKLAKYPPLVLICIGLLGLVLFAAAFADLVAPKPRETAAVVAGEAAAVVAGEAAAVVAGEAAAVVAQCLLIRGAIG
jgi:hypothetical protein